jgi:hypothetical protein
MGNVRSNLVLLDTLKEALPLSADEASKFIRALDAIMGDNDAQKLESSVPQEIISQLVMSIFSFQAVLQAELGQTNIFHTTQKRAYDMTVLINHGEKVLPSEAVHVLGDAKEDFLRDIKAATKSLAFDMPTAMGFHLFRAIETMVVKVCFPSLGVEETEWQRNRNLGHYIGILERKGVSSKVTEALRYLKDNYRNPISHPEEYWDSGDAEAALGLGISVITLMVGELYGALAELFEQSIQGQSHEAPGPLAPEE